MAVTDLLDPPPDLVEIAEALEFMSRPHCGSAWGILGFGVPVATERQEAIWKIYGVTRGQD